MYLISKDAHRFESTFVLNIQNKLSSFYFFWNDKQAKRGCWTESPNAPFIVINNLHDSGIITNGQLLFFSPELFAKIKIGKPITLVVQNSLLEFNLVNSENYALPISGNAIPMKVFNLATADQKYTIQVLDNPSFPLITSFVSDYLWNLQSIMPLPTYPITENLVGLKSTDRKAGLFYRYISGTCSSLEASFTENYRDINFVEFFCPTVGVRYTLKNDTISSLCLFSELKKKDGYLWQTYQGVIWNEFGLGTKRSKIEQVFGKGIAKPGGKWYYPDKRFYLIYNPLNNLVEVEYE